MFVILAACIAAGLEFHEQNVPGLHVQGIDPLTGRIAGNFRSADLDGDGLTDLVLPGRVLFQRDGAFPLEASQVLPRAGERPQCDIVDGVLYYRFSNQLETYTWAPPYWQTTLSHDQVWPDIGNDATPSRGAGVRFSRFLHDFNEDGIPEIMAVGNEGLSIFRRAGSRYTLGGRFDVLPPAIAVYRAQTTLWPPAQRAYQPPLAQMACSLVAEGTSLRIVMREALNHDAARYTVRKIDVLTAPDGAMSLDESAPPTVTGAIPGYMQPCRLNNDGAIDFAGGIWAFAETSVFPTPVFETCASLDGGATIHRVRTEGFRPRTSFLDMDGDGDADLVAERTGLLDGGVRESATRFLTRSAVQHEIRIFHQDALGHFSRTPDLRFRFSIELDAVPFKRTDYFRRYRAGEFVDLTGDVNGDGYRDALVQTSPGELSVFRNSGNRIEKDPAAVVSLPEGASFATADLDNDGRSDIIVTWRGDDPTQEEVTRVYLSRETTP